MHILFIMLFCSPSDIFLSEEKLHYALKVEHTLQGELSIVLFISNYCILLLSTQSSPLKVISAYVVTQSLWYHIYCYDYLMWLQYTTIIINWCCLFKANHS